MKYLIILFILSSLNSSADPATQLKAGTDINPTEFKVGSKYNDFVVSMHKAKYKELATTGEKKEFKDITFTASWLVGGGQLLVSYKSIEGVLIIKRMYYSFVGLDDNAINKSFSHKIESFDSITGKMLIEIKSSDKILR